MKLYTHCKHCGKKLVKTRRDYRNKFCNKKCYHLSNTVTTKPKFKKNSFYGVFTNAS